MNRTRSLLSAAPLALVVLPAACGSPPPGGSGGGANRGNDDAARSQRVLDAGGADAASGSPDGGLDGGCDPNVPLAAKIVAIEDPKVFPHLATKPTPCTDGLACTYQDLQVDFSTCSGPVVGFRLRYLRPLDANIADPGHVPALISEPGSGSCWVGDSSPDVVDEMAANDGAVVLEVAPRGQFKCYQTGDALSQQSDWLGPETLGDYDRLLLAFVKGWVDPKLAADPARLGIHGVSHGGIASFLYGRASHVPAVTGQPLALVMPELGNPDLASWSVPGLDPVDLAALVAGERSDSMPWGGLRIDGLVGWEYEYPGPLFASSLAASVLADDGIPSWVPKFVARSAHDDALGTSVATFVKNTKHFLAVTASEDCIIPHQGAFDFYRQLRGAGAGASSRLVSPVEYHSCGDPGAELTGYLPKVTSENSHRMGQWTSALRSAWISRYLIGAAPVQPGAGFPHLPDPGVGEPTNQPEWMFMLADEGLGTAVPAVYTAPAPGEIATTPTTLSLAAGKTSIAGKSTSFDGVTLSYDPAGDTTLNLTAPAWNQASVEEIDIDFPVTTDDFVVIGQPDVVLFVTETSTPAVDYSFTVLLEDIRPGEPAPWPVGSERRYSHTHAGTTTKQEILLDTVKTRFKKGDTLRVAISNIALMTPSWQDTAPMYAPPLNPFTVAFAANLSGEASRIVLPTVPYASLTKAPAAWQMAK